MISSCKEENVVLLSGYLFRNSTNFKKIIKNFGKIINVSSKV